MYWITSSRRSCSKSTSMSGGSLRSSETKRSNRRSTFSGFDLGDPEAIADHRIRRRAAPLAQDALGAREADDVVDGEEVGRVVAAWPSSRARGRARGAPSARRRPDSGAARPPRRAPPAHPAASRSRCGSRRDIRSSSAPRARSCSGRGSAASGRSPPARGGTAAPSRAGVFRCRSALASSRRPAVSIVTCSRMQVTTSCSGRRSGA